MINALDTAAALHLDAGPVDFALIALYFVFVIGIGIIAKRQVSSSVDFFLSGRSLPAWITGIAFLSANLGATEIMGMSASGAQVGMATFHYYWIGAVPAMVFLGIVMMPFYYGSEVRSVPEFMLRRYGPAAHLVNAISFALAQVLVAGINLFLLATVLDTLFGWSLWFSTIIAAVIVLSYITLGGLSAAIYNEVLQFFVIVAALLPLTLIALHKIGGVHGLTTKLTDMYHAGAYQYDPLASWPGQGLTGFGSAFASVLGITFGLGFVMSFSYFTTNFVEVQRALASKDMNAARRAPIIGSFPKMIIPFIIIIPGMAAAGLGYFANVDHPVYTNALLYLMQDTLPTGLLGVAIAGLMASFMAGMAANVSAFNTVWSYDIWQTYIVKDRDDAYYLRVGRIATVAATVLAVLTSGFAANYSNVMSYMQTLFSFFNAPLFATFILGMFWKRATPTAGWVGLVGGIGASVLTGVLSQDALGPLSVGVLPLSGQGAAFACAGISFLFDILLSVIVSLVTEPKPDAELVGLVHSLTPRDHHADTATLEHWWQSPGKLAIVSLSLTAVLNVIFR